VRPDENSRKPEQINQSIIDDTQVGRDVNIETVNQSITINNPSNTNKPRLRAFQAPPTPEYYVDRPEVTKELKKRLLADGGTLVITAIHGLGSVGKSTVAAALAHDAKIKNHFSDGILWATLGQEPDVLSFLAGWVQGLGDYNYRATSVEATSAHLNTLLFDKAVLLVVDDAWIDESNGWEPVQAFKVGGDRTRMLVTTRDASIANFLGANTFPLGVMTETQALELLTKKVEKRGKRLQQEEIKCAKALAKAVGYLPLALELAAAQVASGTSWQDLIKDIKQEIARIKSFQDPGIRNISNDEKFKKLSLQASLNLSIKRLEENDRECFAWLGVLPEDASITPKMTATLWDMDERDAEEILQYLRSQALLLTGVFLADGTATYRLHDLFHDLARNLLTAMQKPKRQGDLTGLGMKWEVVHAQLLDKYQQQTENNLWHTLPDDGYIHQHLVWHLEKAGKIEEIHQLLREESASGNNGWYEVRERFGQTAGFLTDVAKAWELAETDWEKKNLSYVIGLQCRYGLIITSLNSLAANIPAKVIVVLVRNKFWYPEQGLAYALQKQDAKDKANSLIALLNYLPEVLKNQALQKILEAVCQINSDRIRTLAFSTLAQNLPENLYEKILEVLIQIKDESYRADALNALAENIPEHLYERALELVYQIENISYQKQALIGCSKYSTDNLCSEALKTALRIPDLYARAKAIAILAKTLPENFHEEILNEARKIKSVEYSDRIFMALSQNLIDKKLYRQALEISCQINFDFYRASALITLANNLPINLLTQLRETGYKIKTSSYKAIIISVLAERQQDEKLYNEALKITHQIHNEEYITEVLYTLSERLIKSLNQEVLKIARRIKNQKYYAEALSILGENFQDENLYNEALEVASQIRDEYYRCKILRILCEKLQDENLYREAIETARQIQYEYYRAEVLSNLAKKLPENLYHEAIEAARQIRDKYSRAEVLSVLAEKLQDEKLYREVIELARQIQYGEDRAKVLSILAEKLQDEKLYREAIEVARQIRDEYSRAKVLSYLAEKLQDEKLYREVIELARQIQDEDPRAEVLSILAKALQNKNLYHEVIELARQIQDEYPRAEVLSVLAETLRDKNLYREAIKTARQITDERNRAQILRCLGKTLPENLYREVIKTARKIQDEYSRAKALSSLAEKLEDENLYREVIDAVRQIQSEYYRVEVLSNLGQKLPANLYHEVIDIARQIRNEYYRVQILLAVVKNISLKRPINKIFSVWQEILQLSSRLEREKFQQIIQELIPVISQLGGKEALTEVATAIQDVSRWWR
jgi:hypothetical protein